MKISTAVTVGEIITFLSIAGSGLSIVVSWNADRDLHKREDADKIRVEAAQALGKVQRAADIYLSYYDAVQSDLVEASEALEKSRSNTEARDLLWKRLEEERYATSRMILDEQLEVAYAGLLPFDPGIDSLYSVTMNRLKALNANETRQLLTQTERRIMEFPRGTGQTALLGNVLRDVVADQRREHEALLHKGMEPLENHLKQLIHSPDHRLLARPS